MSVKLLTEHDLEFPNLKGGCTGSSESTLVKMSHFGNHMSRLKCITFRKDPDGEPIRLATVVTSCYTLGI